MNAALMASDTFIPDSADPLSGLNGPSLFPRTIGAAIGCPLPAHSKDLDSIHEFMKSLKELRSPEKLMNEAKRIVDGGAELLESNLVGFPDNVGVRDAIAAKGKAKPQERRPGLGIARKRPSFSLKASASQPSVSLEPTLDIDQLQDPDEFFDAYEKLENAKKEIQKQLGGNMDNLNQHKPSIARHRRQGILGKSYNYKHRYLSAPIENDDMFSSQETVKQDIPDAPKDDSQENLINPDPFPDVDLEEAELAVSEKETEDKVNNILDELLSCNNEDLDGDGALNLLQERLNFKPLDLENLFMRKLHNGGRTSISTERESLLKPFNSSLDIGSVLKHKSKPPVGHGQLTQNPVSPVTSPGSPFSSLSLLKKKILQSNPQRDPFSPLNADLSACQNASVVKPINKLHEQIDPPKYFSIPIELQSRVEAETTAIPIMDALKVIGSADSLPNHFVDDNTSIQSASACNMRNEEPDYNVEETRNIENLHDNHSKPSVLEKKAMDAPSSQHQFDAEQQAEVDSPKDFSIASELQSQVEAEITEPIISNMDAPKVIESADSLPSHFVDDNTSIQSANDCNMPNEEPDYNIEETRNTENLHDSSVLKNRSKPPLGHEWLTQNPVCPVTSLPRSPFSSVSLLKKRILHSNSQRNPFSPLNVDLSACKNTSVVLPINKLHEQFDPPTDFSLPVQLQSRVEGEITEPAISNMDKLKVIGSADSLPDHSVDDNTSIQSSNACKMPNEEPDYHIEETRNNENLHDNHPNPSVLEDKAMNAPSSQHQFDAEQQPEVHQTKLQISERKAGEKRIRKAHPMRKSLAEAGTSFENGLRRSKRIKMRPLEYWKGERFLYGRVNDSLKLIGVKYSSPGKDSLNLKVKPYISSESSEVQDLLEWAARH